MRLAAIFVNYRTPELTLTAVTKLLAELSDVGEHHILVVDNDSQDGSVEAISAGIQERGLSKAVTVLAAPRNGGYGYGINFAVAYAGKLPSPPAYFYIINTDAVPDPGSVRKLVDFMDAHPDAGLAGSVVHGPEGDVQGAAFRFPTVLSELDDGAKLGIVSKLVRRHVVAMPTPAQSVEVDWVPGTSMLVRAEVFSGGVAFDEDFFLYFEEIDFAKQVAAAGWRTWFVADAPIAHLGSYSTGLNDGGKAWPDYYFDSRWRYFTKYHGARYALACSVVRAAGQSVYSAKCRLLRRPYRERPKTIRGIARSAVRWRLREERSADELNLVELFVEDFTAHGRSLASTGFWAVYAHRVGERAVKGRPVLLRNAVRIPRRALSASVSLLSRIHIGEDTKLGRRVQLLPGGTIVLDAQSVGDDVRIHHDTTVGPLRGDDSGAQSLPQVGAGAEIRSGAAVLGPVKVGGRAVVANNSVVLKDVPEATTVVGVPARAAPPDEADVNASALGPERARGAS